MHRPGPPPPAGHAGTEGSDLHPMYYTYAEPVSNVRNAVKQSTTKKSRVDLSAAMVNMCQLTGWRDTTLNPDLDDHAKMAMLASRFGKVTVTDDDSALYDELIALSATSMGWAQGIARRDARDRKRTSRAARKARRAAKRAARAGVDKPVGPAGTGDAGHERRHAKGDHSSCLHGPDNDE